MRASVETICLPILLQRPRLAHDLNGAWPVETRTAMTVPLLLSPLWCGFPSPADDYLDRPIDFNELLIANQPATFTFRAKGDSMKDAGIFAGDLLIVDRSLTAGDGSIIVAVLFGECTVKRLRRLAGGGVVLEAANPAFRDIPVSEECGFEVWGVVKHTIRTMR